MTLARHHTRSRLFVQVHHNQARKTPERHVWEMTRGKCFIEDERVKKRSNVEETKEILKCLEEKYTTMQRLAHQPFSPTRHSELSCLACDMRALVLALQRLIQAEMALVHTLRIHGREDGDDARWTR